MSAPPFLIGDRIYLRGLEPEDAPTLRGFLNNVEVIRNITVVRPVSLQDELDFIETMRKGTDKITFGLALKSDERLIGVTSLMEIDTRNRHAAFGILIGDPAEWDKGYGTEATRMMVDYAFRTQNLNRVWLRVYEYNPRGRRAYEKVGFAVEGVLRQDNYRDGRYWDTTQMSILRSDWPLGA